MVYSLSVQVGFHALEALRESAKNPLLEVNRSQRAVIENALARIFKKALRGQVNDAQLNFCETDGEICRLFVMYSRAVRGVEGYGFKGKVIKSRYVVGPKKEGIQFKATG